MWAALSVIGPVPQCWKKATPCRLPKESSYILSEPNARDVKG